MKFDLVSCVLVFGLLFICSQTVLAQPICPIGTGDAPNLRDPDIASGAQCRGACGEDCPSNRCDPVAHIIIPVEDPMTGQKYNCIYNNVVSCLTHKGCRDHDACYDMCAEAGEGSIYGPWHLNCNSECFAKWGYSQCIAWSDATGYLADYWINPDFDGVMLFSDPPQLIGPIGQIEDSEKKTYVEGYMYTWNAGEGIPWEPLTSSSSD